MIGFRDTVTLARTKLRTKRTRLIVTVVVSGLVFGLIIGIFIIFSGITKSLERYAHEQFGGTYFVTANQYTHNNYDDLSDQKRVSRVKEIHKTYIEERRQAAAKLGIAYDPSEELPPVERYPNEDVEYINENSIAGQREQEEYYTDLLAKNVALDQSYLKKQSAPYDPLNISDLELLTIGQPSIMKDGIETFQALEVDEMYSNFAGWSGGETATVDKLLYRFAEPNLINSYVLPQNEKRRTSVKAIPVVLPVDTAVKTFKDQKKLSAKPKDAQQLTVWFNSMRDALNGETYDVCYRNEASISLIQQAVDQKKEIAANKGKAGYQSPEVVYELPDSRDCGAVTVKDVRSQATKQAEQNYRDFETMGANKQETAVQQKLTFVIVGLSPSGADYSDTDLQSFISSFVGVNIPEANMVPRDLYEALPTNTQFKNLLTEQSLSAKQRYEVAQNKQYLVSFDSIDAAKSYIEKEGCSLEESFANDGCPSTKPAILGPFGTNYMAINELVTIMRPALLVVLAIISLVAAVIIMAMMGRVMADSRRETAVFRAIGARMSDIVKVYVLYALAVALRIALFALLLGITFGLVLEALYSARASYYASTAFGVFESSIGFHFIGASWYIVAVISGIIMLGLIGIVPPLLRNIRRNPIKDMRDE